MTAQPIGVHLCCGATFQLTPTATGWTGQAAHLDHCPATP